MSANNTRSSVPTKGYRIFLYGFSVDYRIWQNKYMRWMKTVTDGKQRIDKWVITKTYRDNDSSDYHMIGADMNRHKDGPIFTTVGSRTRVTLLRIAGK